MTQKQNPSVPNTEPFDEGTGYSDVVTPGAQRSPRNVRLVNPSQEIAGNDSGGEGGTSGNHGGDATENPDGKVDPRPVP